MRAYIYSILILLFLSSPATLADGPPPAPEVAATITNYWATSQFTQLEVYVTNLYASYTDYIPSKLAMSFYQYVFKGNITEAIAQVESVQKDLTENPSAYSNSFVVSINQTALVLSEDKALFLRMGSLSQIDPSPSSTRNTWGDTLLPPLEALIRAPSRSIP